MSRLNEREIRVSLANWMNEECAFALQCPHIAKTWDSSNILIGDFHCDAQENVLRLLVLKEPFSGYKSCK
uniref:Uncharacterized protein n=1 Tax=Acrobeloides nanus TaxID=290746 RepID=A0A914EGP2_9BILA